MGLWVGLWAVGWVWVGFWAVDCGGFTISCGSQRPWHGLLVDAAFSWGVVVFLVLLVFRVGSWVVMVGFRL